MVRRTFSIVLSVKRGLPQEDIFDWIDESLQGVTDFNSFHTLAVTYYPVRELIYGQIKTLHFTNISDNRVRDCLSCPPDDIQVIEILRMENRDSIAEMPVVTDYEADISRTGSNW